MSRPDRNCLSWWFPRLLESGAPVPRTELVATAPDLSGEELADYLGGAAPGGGEGGVAPRYSRFVVRLAEAVRRMQDASGRGDVFLRTGHTAGKHDWRHTCYLRPEGGDGGRALCEHVGALAMRSATAGLFGLPVDVWAVRELLPTNPVCHLERYGGMPLVAEVRAFVGGGVVECFHPYWPAEAIAAGVADPDADDIDAVVSLAASILIEDVPAVLGTLKLVADGFAGLGRWSVDLLDTAGGWVVTDMAEADRSWHWPACPAAPPREGRAGP